MPKFLKRLQSMWPLAAFLNAAGPQRVKREQPQGQKVKSTNGSRYFLKYNSNLETNWKYSKSLEIQLFKLTPMKPFYLLYMCDGLHVQSQSLHVR